MTEPVTSTHTLLADFQSLGVLSWGDVHVADTIASLYDETDERAILALALAVGALQAGSVCLDLAHVRQTLLPDAEDTQPVPDEWWPDEAGWRAALESSPMVALGSDAPTGRPLRLAGDLLYLERYWNDEVAVADQLIARRCRVVDGPGAEAVRQALDSLPAGVLRADETQTAAVATALLAPVSVIAGGPGTGKTATIARLLAALAALGGPRVALAAPTGKAAARMDEAIAAVLGGASRDATAMPPGHGDRSSDGSVGIDPPGTSGTHPLPHAQTIHRLLGWTPESRNRFVHRASNPLPDDVVIVDEASMVSLPLMARLLEALKPDARLVLVGDPDQLAPVEAGAVLADIVDAPNPLPPSASAELSELGVDAGSAVVRLRTNWRFGGPLGDLATAVRLGDADDALRLASLGGDEIAFGPDEDAVGLKDRVLGCGLAMLDAGRRGDADAALAALGTHQLLCAHRQGPHGVSWWNRQAESWLAAADPGLSPGQTWYPGRPILVTQNAPDLGLFNGDTGVVVGDDACFERGGRRSAVSVFLLDQVQTAHAMTVHKAQGSQFDAVSLILPPPDSPLLTRELLYTAITRARSRVAIVGSPEALRAAVTHRARRASGLAARLRQGIADAKGGSYTAHDLVEP